MKRKQAVMISIVGIIMIVIGAYMTAQLIRKDKLEEVKQEEKEEETLKVRDQVINLKLYRVNQSFFIKVPDNFFALSQEQLKTNYPTASRPEFVFQNEDNSTHVFITITNDEMTEDNLGSYLASVKATIPNYEIREEKLYDRYGKKFAKLSSVDPVANGLYHDLRYFILEGKIVKVEFNTTPDQEEDWKEVSEKILASISFSEEDTKKE